ncbi:5'-nucleotidase [Tumidithrix helvetica PCC 7403]|uniref:bifunctional metallophosphatase/5'-nucleotidase n=1 Tax=Tumidithrix helvetica TaxID=3457545 RepID=UPI003C98E71B
MRKFLMRRFLFLAVISLLVVLYFAPFALSKSELVNIRILAINDFHGNLEAGNLTFPPSAAGDRIPVGGVEYLATHIKNLRVANPHIKPQNTVTVSAGDTVGASPLISALFHDEPAIEALNALGLELNAVGNHEFDEGAEELYRKQKGGCHPVDGCRDGDGFGGAKFKFLAANVINYRNGKPIFPAYQVRTFNGIKMAFIGLTLKGTSNLVGSSGIVGLEFKDEAATVNALIPKLKKQGIKAIAVLLHEGGLTTGNYNGCEGISGAIVDIVKHTDPEVDLFITGHTHQAYNCQIDRRLVTSASFYGRLVSDIDVTLDRGTGDVASMQANNVVVTHDVPKDPALSQIVLKYKAIADPLVNRAIGSITADITRIADRNGISPLGRTIADAQLAATADASQGGAVAAFMNPGGIRTDLSYSESEVKGVVTYGQAFAVQPFRNRLVTMTLTGKQIKELLERQFDNPRSGQNRILQVSQGFTYNYSNSAALGNRVSNIAIAGIPIVPDSDYRITVNSYLADGGDNFAVLKEGRDRLVGALDIEALEAYFKMRSPISPNPANN